jgi:hypothetical protein
MALFRTWAAIGVAGCLAACAAAPPATPDAAAGSWEMDLSPSQDWSYTQELRLSPAKERRAGLWTFDASVYGGNPTAGGLAAWDGRRWAWTCVSDPTGEHGGPYYWLGWTTDAGRQEGAVRSEQRGFEMLWQARRTAPDVAGREAEGYHSAPWPR